MKKNRFDDKYQPTESADQVPVEEKPNTLMFQNAGFTEKPDLI